MNDWQSSRRSIIEDLNEAVRRARADSNRPPCKHFFIKMHISEITGVPTALTCMACGIPIPISQDELEKIYKEQFIMRDRPTGVAESASLAFGYAAQRAEKVAGARQCWDFLCERLNQDIDDHVRAELHALGKEILTAFPELVERPLYTYFTFRKKNPFLNCPSTTELCWNAAGSRVCETTCECCCHVETP